MKKVFSIVLGILRGIGTVLAVVLCTVATLLCLSVIWMFDTWNNLTMDELVYHITAPMEGTNDGMIWEYINVCAVPAILVLIVIIVLFIGFRKHKRIYNTIICIGIIVPIVAACKYINYTWENLDVSTYVEGQSTYSTFIDNNYVDPREVSITFPEQKRNLIYIFLESMETTYADKENGGGFDQDVIPELTQIAQANEDFSGEETALNGGYSMPGTTWTMGAMFAHTSGLPLNVTSIGGNDMDTQESFFSGAVTLGDILRQEGYSQTLMVGSDATFGGRRLYFTEHGNYDILDYNYAHAVGWIPEGYRVWWGFEDEKLFGFAKEQILQLANEGNPFNFTMLTVDTHFEDGYVCDLCPDTYGDDQYANVMACSSRQVTEFISWIQQQSFYENTTIVVVGDHPTMDKNFCEDIDRDYVRKVYTTYINPAAELQTLDKRNYSTFDSFPTVIASLGAQIDGDRLGLGTNLFSKTPTLVERFGVDKVKIEMNRKSQLMEQLADIDLNTDALVERANAPSLKLAVKDYDSYTGNFAIIADEFVNIDTENIWSLSAAVWTSEDQGDLQWIPLGLQEDGSYIGYANEWNFFYPAGDYIIHLYLTDHEGNSNIIGAITTKVKEPETEETGTEETMTEE